MTVLDIKALPHQYEALKALEKYSHTLLVGGIGSGKTFLGCLFLLQELQRWNQGDKSYGLITANSYGQLRRSVLTEVFKNMTEWGISVDYNQQQSLLTLNGTKKFFCLSTDPSSIDKVRGLNCGSSWADEQLYCPSIEIYNTVQGRIRDRQGSGKYLATSSPVGFNWGYDVWAGELHNPKTHYVVKAKTHDNKYLREGFIDDMILQLDEKGVQQEIYGEWVARNGQSAYYQFNRERHVKPVKYEGQHGYACLDFNVDPLVAVLGFYEGNVFKIFEEIYLEGGSDTYMMASEIKRRGYGHFEIIADSTYTNRKTSGTTDKTILQNAGFTTLHTRNPLVIHRVTNCNRLFGQDRVQIDPSCKKLIKDFEQVTFLPNGKLDQRDRTLTHLSDSAGYFFWKLAKIDSNIRKTAYSIKR